ncbi:MAG TPA: 5-carboxymethyl-2-hydroxymuconate Delta-isomerase [Sphingomicrobium sp.]|nr:5-carboxymethyl-2-hydroxymuconate Delta-isomerase [Sphingomicrobium sp.]
MPQVLIEYSQNVADIFDARGLALRLHQEMAPIIDSPPEEWKTRLIELEKTVIGDGSDNQAMIHVDVRILTGRSDVVKRRLGEAVLILAKAAVERTELKLQITVEVRELDRPNYHKFTT